MHRATILCLHYPGDRAANAKQGQEPNAWIPVKAGTVFCVHGQKV